MEFSKLATIETVNLNTLVSLEGIEKTINELPSKPPGFVTFSEKLNFLKW